MRTLTRRLALPAFAAATAGWAAGLASIHATASPLALVLSTACGIVALASLATWHRAGRPA